MARVFVNYTPQELLSLSVIMAVMISREYDIEDQVVLAQLLSSVSTNISLITDQSTYLEQVREKTTDEMFRDQVNPNK